MLCVGEVPACAVVTFVSWFNPTADAPWHLEMAVGLMSLKANFSPAGRGGMVHGAAENLLEHHL